MGAEHAPQPHKLLFVSSAHVGKSNLLVSSQFPHGHHCLVLSAGITPGPTTTPQAAAEGSPGHGSQCSQLILHGDNNHVEHSVPAGDSASSTPSHPMVPPGPLMPLSDLDSSHGSTLEIHPQHLFILLLLQIRCLLKSKLPVLRTKPFFELFSPQNAGDPGRVHSTAAFCAAHGSSGTII